LGKVFVTLAAVQVLIAMLALHHWTLCFF